MVVLYVVSGFLFSWRGGVYIFRIWASLVCVDSFCVDEWRMRFRGRKAVVYVGFSFGCEEVRSVGGYRGFRF